MESATGRVVGYTPQCRPVGAGVLPGPVGCGHDRRGYPTGPGRASRSRARQHGERRSALFLALSPRDEPGRTHPARLQPDQRALQHSGLFDFLYRDDRARVDRLRARSEPREARQRVPAARVRLRQRGGSPSARAGWSGTTPHTPRRAIRGSSCSERAVGSSCSRRWGRSRLPVRSGSSSPA